MERRSINNLTLFILTTTTTLAVGVGVAIFSAMQAPGVLVASMAGSMAAGASAVVLNTTINLSLRTYDLFQSIKKERIYNKKFNADLARAEASRELNGNDAMQRQMSSESEVNAAIGLKPVLEKSAGTSNTMTFASDHTPPDTAFQRDILEASKDRELLVNTKKRQLAVNFPTAKALDETTGYAPLREVGR